MTIQNANVSMDMSKKLKPCANCGGVGVAFKKQSFIHNLESWHVQCDGITRKDDEDDYKKLPCGLGFEGFADEITLPTLKKRWNKLYDRVHKQEEDL